MQRVLMPAALCLLLIGCSGEEGGAVELSATDQARAEELLQKYQRARTAGNPEAAEAAADMLRERFPESGPAAQLEATLQEVRAAAEAARQAQRLGRLWDYQANAAGGGIQRSAAIFSQTAEADEDLPAQIPDAQLVLRDHPEWGRSAYLLLALSKFDCGKPCTMRIAFDEATAETYPGKQADSGKGPALFIEDEPRFIQALQAAERVRIELPKGSGSVPALAFEVGGFDAARYEKP